MKTYIITSVHTVHIDSFEEGELGFVNSYDLKSTIKASTPKEAVEKYFETVLFLPFHFEAAYIFHKEDPDVNQDKNTLEYTSLVDVENNEPSKTDIELWTRGQKELYSNSAFISVYELIGVTL